MSAARKLVTAQEHIATTQHLGHTMSRQNRFRCALCGVILLCNYTQVYNVNIEY